MLRVYDIKPDSIQKEFNDPEEMVTRAATVIDRNMKTIMSVTREGYFNSVYMGYETNTKIKLDSVYENGVIYSIDCIPDSFAGKYDVYTTALLVCIDGKDPEFIIDCPSEKREKLIEQMGTRLDRDFIDGLKDTRKKIAPFGKKLHKLKMELISRTMELVIKNSIIELMKIEKEQKKKI